METMLGKANLNNVHLRSQHYAYRKIISMCG